MPTPKKHPRIVPRRDLDEGVVEFSDGSRVVPDWQLRYLGVGEQQIEMTYEEWVQKVVNAHIVNSIFRRARRDLVSQHLNR